MEREKAKFIQNAYQWCRIIVLAIVAGLLFIYLGGK